MANLSEENLELPSFQSLWNHMESIMVCGYLWLFIYIYLYFGMQCNVEYWWVMNSYICYLMLLECFLHIERLMVQHFAPRILLTTHSWTWNYMQWGLTSFVLSFIPEVGVLSHSGPSSPKTPHQHQSPNQLSIHSYPSLSNQTIQLAHTCTHFLSAM